jgi:SNF2 family DNA or RNA helicase
MINMSKIFLNDSKNLVVNYTLTRKTTIDYDVKIFFELADFTEKYIDDSQIQFEYSKNDISDTAIKIINFFKITFSDDSIEIDDHITKYLAMPSDAITLNSSLENSQNLKSKSIFEPKLSKSFKRELLDFQKYPVEHLLAVNNGANFSVPGSGKTTMTLAVIANWLEQGIVEKIMVIGPIASFGSWEDEFELCFDKNPNSVRVHGDIASILNDVAKNSHLILAHYQTANARRNELRKFLETYKTVLIVDESHNIKNPKVKKWASALLDLAPYAKRRIILSGTPMPQDEQDLWTQMTFLYPTDFPLGNVNSYCDEVKKHGLNDHHKNILDSLFSRVKKKDLNLPEPKFIKVPVVLGEHQRQIYDIIAEKTLEEIELSEEQEKLNKFRLVRFIRLMQIASNPSLLSEQSREFNIDSPLFESNSEMISAEFGFDVHEINNEDLKLTSIYEKISNYSDLEIPSKIVTAGKIARDLYNKGEKVIIWSTFLLNIDVFKDSVLSDLNPIAIDGRVSRNLEESPNRDELINKFKNSPNPEILIASPASLGESVSLHKNLQGETVCTNAIYFDRNFNGAQFMQSVDRIHRVGMDKDVEVTYHLCIGTDTIDERIDQRLWEKWQNMTNALNDPFLSTVQIDVLNEPESEFVKDYQSLVEHLRELKQKNKEYDSVDL